jgi:hypoxanthine phosphoribosyltransferase
MRFAASAILSFDHGNFDHACSRLMQLVNRDERPDMLIAIPAGGMHVARAMAAAAGDLPVIPLTCRRPSSRRKHSPLVRKLIASLPLPLLDRLRLLEHAMLTGRATAAPDEARCFDARELNALLAAITAAGTRPSLLVVDDAVDTGATLSAVLKTVARCAPAGATIRSAAITVTTSHPLVSTDYALYREQLCRFPWSLDAITASPS